MGPAEVAGRIACEARNKRLRYASGRQEALLKDLRIPDRESLARCLHLVPGASSAEINQLQQEHPEYYVLFRDAVLRRANRIVDGKLCLLGKAVSITPEIDWHADPETGFSWSNDFFTQVSYHKIPAHVDFKNIWELGRQQYVAELSRSWLLCGEPSHGDLAREMMISWIDGNPFCQGIHWTSGLEVGVRAISWIWSLANLSEYSAWKEGERERILQSLALHAYYLENRFSYYSSPYNHIIGEAAGLYLIASVLKGCRDSERWRQAASKVLNRFGPEQFYADGFCVEQAMGYHYFTTGFLILAQLAAERDGDDSLKLRETICGAMRTGRMFRQADGTWPAIGDVDSASSIPVERTNYWDFSSMHRLAATAFQDQSIDVGCHATQSGEASCPPQADETYWLLGCEGIQKLSDSPTAEPRAAILKASGYFVAKDENDSLLFDSGPIAGGVHHDSVPSVAHGHADTLQLLYQFRGRPILIDSGMPNYAGNRERADYFRSPQAHNTVVMDGVEVVRPAGSLAWSNEVETPTLEASIDASPYWTGVGEIRWPQCRMRRHVLLIPNQGLWIADWLESDMSRTASWHWQFHTDTQLALCSSIGTIAAEGDGVSVSAIGSSELRAGTLTIADPSGAVGWMSPGYGVLLPGLRITYQATVDQTLLVLTRIGDADLQVGFEIKDKAISFANQTCSDDAVRANDGPRVEMMRVAACHETENGCWHIPKEIHE